MGFAKGKPKVQTTREFFEAICPKHSLPLAECCLRKNGSVKVRLDFMDAGMCEYVEHNF